MPLARRGEVVTVQHKDREYVVFLRDGDPRHVRVRYSQTGVATTLRVIWDASYQRMGQITRDVLELAQRKLVVEARA
ncbi:hypothetical protein AWB81_01766 [Caballeronia arationis]|uniref:hypothetical protein n=1 Tax=Caballeronia arationis TaxID=1777142 RepID=UPI00074CF64C|nr:hypothetical protein [Caballeronia arationis]SAK58896.1 hypothetical protein AWB81_01766 [Caballeronia arationis]